LAMPWAKRLRRSITPSLDTFFFLLPVQESFFSRLWLSLSWFGKVATEHFYSSNRLNKGSTTNIPERHW
jgi:hypothetical protein